MNKSEQIGLKPIKSNHNGTNRNKSEQIKTK